jgi:hypothetical protein
MTVKNQAANVQMSIEDELSDFAADLIGEAHNESFIRHLFALTPGTWSSVRTICRQAQLLTKRLDDLEATADGELRVVWMDYPESSYGEGYCVILFFQESIHWSSVALYNKGRLTSGEAA